MHVRVAFQAEQLRHPHRANAAGAAQVVAQQVDNHQVFRPVLGAGQQLGGVGCVFAGRCSAGPGALDRPGFHMAFADLDEAFGRQAQHRAAIGQALETGKRRRARRPQRLVSGPGIALAGRAKALGKIDLVAVTRLDIRLDTLEGLSIGFGAEVGDHRSFEAEGANGGRSRLAEQGDQALAFAFAAMGWKTNWLVPAW